MLDGNTGTFAEAPVNLETMKGWEEMVGKADTSERVLYVYEGEAGCGKSYGLCNVLKKPKYKRDRCFNVSLPTSVLADDWRVKLGVRDIDPKTDKGTPYHYVTTFERTLASGCWGWFMVWDEDKFPKGYMDLVMFMFPHVRHFAFCCDRYQSEWHEPNSKCRLNDPNIPGNARLLTTANKLYIYGTMRFGPGIANFQRMITFSSDPGGYHFSSVMPKQAMDLAVYFPHKTKDELIALWKGTEFFYASHAATHWAEQLAQQDAVTFAGSQGLTADLAIVEIDEKVLRLNIYRLIHTVLNRARNYLIVTVYPDTGVNRIYIEANKILYHLLWYRDRYQVGRPVQIVPEHSYRIEEVLQDPLPEDVRRVVIRPPEKCTNTKFIVNFPDVISVLGDYLDNNRSGARLTFDGFYEDKHTFKSRIIDYQVPKISEGDVTEGLMSVATARTHLPESNLETLQELHRARIPTRFAAELSWKGVWSEQKPDLPMFKKNGQELLRRLARREGRKALAKLPKRHEPGFEERIDVFQPDMLLLGLDQKASDHASFAAGMKQRIRVGTYLENLQEIQDSGQYGTALFQAFCKAAGFDEERFDVLSPQEIENYKMKFNVRRAERSEALKAMSLNRSEPDYVDFLTAKTQWKHKEPEHTKAKGLQPIFVRSDEYLFRMGWVGVMMLDKLMEELPPHIYIHAQKSIADVKAWFLTYTKDYEKHEMLDMSGLDGSVRGGAINMMVHFMRRYGVPAEEIDFYVNDKANFHTRSKHLALMTLSGEIFTYLINTLFTMSREMLKYDYPYGRPIAGSGDDINREAGLPISQRWQLFERYDYCVEKRFESEVGELISFKVVKGLIYKDPIILFGRLLGQLERGKVDEISLGYFELFSHSYILKDTLYSVMTEEELEHQSAINYVMFNLKKFGCTTKLPWHKLQLMDISDTSWEILSPSFIEKVGVLMKTQTDSVAEVDIHQEIGLSRQMANFGAYTARISSNLTWFET
jgi:hypothetical protein